AQKTSDCSPDPEKTCSSNAIGSSHKNHRTMPLTKRHSGLTPLPLQTKEWRPDLPVAWAEKMRCNRTVMPTENQTRTAGEHTSARFEHTRWTLILESHKTDALAELCKIYWPPLYSYLRLKGHNSADAKDLTQGFFEHLLSNNGLRKVHPEKGKFRSFLLACLNNYVTNEWVKGRAQKRGGDILVVPIEPSDDTDAAELPLAGKETPESIFEKKWAISLLSQVAVNLKQKYVADGKHEAFEVFKPFLSGESNRGDYAKVAAQLEMKEGAVRTAVSRFKSDYREFLYAEVLRTVDDPSEVEPEIRHLLTIWQNG
ncbi:MAG: sigma-70 family RNA polymerase sigma factor, partial [Verrucomicrobiota bacterium]